MNGLKAHVLFGQPKLTCYLGVTVTHPPMAYSRPILATRATLDRATFSWQTYDHLRRKTGTRYSPLKPLDKEPKSLKQRQ